MRKLLTKSEVFVLFFLVLFSGILIGGMKLNPDPNPIVQASNGCSQTPTIPTGYSPNGVSIGNVIPVPAYVIKTGGSFHLLKSSQIYVNPGSSEIVDIGKYLASKINPSTGFNIPVTISGNPPTTDGTIYLSLGLDPSFGQEGYKLVVTNSTVTLSAFTSEGLFRGIQTIRQLLPPEIDSKINAGKPDFYWTMDTGTIVDYPRFIYRGMMFDVARSLANTFYDLPRMEKLIDVLAEYKVNCLHIHLTDNEGWRIQIKAYPNLAGGYVSGFYTQDQFQHLIAYAKQNYITIIPEIDMPGHSGWACKILGCGSYIPPNNANFKFIDTVLKELTAISPGLYFHIGADEPFGMNFNNYITMVNYEQKEANSLQKSAIGWNDMAAANIQKSTVLEYWENKDQGAFAKDVNKGTKIILSPWCNGYLYQLLYSCGAGDPIIMSYNWNPQTYFPYFKKDTAIGVEGTLWTDTGNDSMIFPPMIGLAEVGWSPQSKRNLGDYLGRLESQAIRLNEMGFSYTHSHEFP